MGIGATYFSSELIQLPRQFKCYRCKASSTGIALRGSAAMTAIFAKVELAGGGFGLRNVIRMLDILLVA